MVKPPILIEAFPPQLVMEGAEYPALDCTQFIIPQDDDETDITFSASLTDGSALPAGIVCSADGLFHGQANEGTEGQYEVVVTANNASKTPVSAVFPLYIIPKQTVTPDSSIILKKMIPAIVVNQGAALGPIDLNQYVQAANATDNLYFRAELDNGEPFPRGIICTSNGILSGIPANETVGYYPVRLTVENKTQGGTLETPFILTIKERIAMSSEQQFYTQLKTQVWNALGKNQPVPEFEELFNRQLTAVEIYYLMQRFATLTVYDVYNLDPPSQPVLLRLSSASPHYNVYDRGCCIVATPKDLYSYERTLADALMTAKAIAREVYKRGWTIELVGFNKMIRASWVELQILGEQHGKFLDVLYYTPTQADLKLCETELKSTVIATKGL